MSELIEVNEAIKQRLVHEVHTSERRSFRGCRRRWSWLFQDFYYPQTTAKPLEFGVAFHNAMEVLYDPGTWKWDREVVKNSAITTFVNRCNDQKKQYEKNFDMSPEVEEDYKERVALGVGMLEYYCKDVAPIYDAHMTPLKVEVEFIVPIQNPDDGSYLYCKCKRCMITIDRYVHDMIEAYYDHREDERKRLKQQGLVVCLAGRIDLLAEDEHGDYWIVDWKTAARLSRGDASGQDRDEFLELDDQIGSYVMALRRKLGLNVRGFVYVELKKAFPEPPKRNVQQRLGCWYSINRQQAVDVGTFTATVKENDKEAYEAGRYDGFIEYLTREGQRFHGRYQISKTEEELEEIERTLFMESSDMVDVNLRVYPSPGRFSCGFCAFRQPCLEKYRQGDYQYILDTMFDRRKEHYWVKKELSTESQGGE